MPGYLRDLGDLDDRSLALFRILCAIVVLWDIGVAWSARDIWAGVQGYYEGLPLLAGLGDPGQMLGLEAFLVAYAFATLCMLFGWRTPLATLAVWIATCGFQYLSPYTIDYHDAVLANLLLWSQFLGLGRAWSVDALRATPQRSRDLLETIGGCAFVLSFAFIYLDTAWQKSGPAWHGDGTAVWFALKSLGVSTGTGRWALEHLPFALFRAATHLVWTVELVAPLLLLSPWRRFEARGVGCALLIGMHAGMWLLMDLEAFSLTMIAGACALLPGGLWSPRRDAPASVPEGRARHPLAAGALVALLVAAPFANVEGARILELDESPYAGAEYVELAKRWLGLETDWAMYSPEPADFTGWWVAVAHTADGREVDPITGDPPRLDKPDPGLLYTSLERRYWLETPDSEGYPYANYVRFLLWRDRRANPPGRRVTHLTLLYLYEPLLPLHREVHPAIPTLAMRWPEASGETRPALPAHSVLSGTRLYAFDPDAMQAGGFEAIPLPLPETY